jgi:hypothetical protein
MIVMELMNIFPKESNPELLVSTAAEREVSGRLVVRGPQETALPGSGSLLSARRVLQFK